MIYTASKLHREFGLSFATAELIIREQTALARKPYRGWFMLAWIGFATALFVNLWAPQEHRWLIPVVCVCVGIAESLALRRAQPLIQAAAYSATAHSR